MDAATWARLKELFAAATEAPDRIPDVLREAAAESPELFHELRSLLSEHSSHSLSTSAVMSQVRPAVEAHPSGGPALANVGPYRILRELGRGGTGVVLLAERQDDEFHRQVALKVLRYVAWDARSRDQLTLERRVLSQLQHPNIAALVDWGETPEGAQWLATEYVEGEPIDRYCRSRGFAVNQTLAIFEQVCHAVQYAHRRLVVHRDLKPANILVTDSGLVKLLDFGISKPLADETVTSIVDRRFTPAYASPEQIKGEPISAATDVYALGLLLYELLTGQLPFRADSVEEMARRLEDREVAPPSSVESLTASARKAIRGDIDRIVMHSLEREPERRYPSVEQLLADLDRYRSGYPISAQRSSAAYRSGKFLRRHALPLTAAALALSALIVGTVVAVTNARVARQEQRNAERRFKDVQSLAHAVMFDLHDSIRRVPDSAEARHLLIQTAVKYLDSLGAENIHDDSVQMEIASGYIRMGYAQGGLTGVNLGDTVGSRRSYGTALRILEVQTAKRPEDVQAQVMRYGAAYNLSMMINDPAEGLALAQPFAAQADAWVARGGAAPALQASELLHSAAGRILRRMGRFDESLHEFDLASRAQDTLMAADLPANSPQPMFSASIMLVQEVFDAGLTAFARTQTLLDLNRVEEAYVSVDKARALFERAARMSAPGPSDSRMFARVHGLKAAVLLRLGRIAEAQAESEIEMTAALANLGDGSATAQRDLAEAHRHAGGIHLAKRNFSGALFQFRLAAELIGTLAAKDPAFLVNRTMHASMLIDYGYALRAARQEDGAVKTFKTAVSLLDAAIAEAPSWASLVRERNRARSAVDPTTID